MPTAIEQLLGVLETSESVYQQLLPVIHAEKQAALSARPDQLVSASEEKEVLLFRLRELDRQRRTMIARIAAARSLPIENIRLSTLADSTDATQASRARRLSASFKELVPKIRKANEENRAVIRHCLDVVQGALGFFQHWVRPTDVYGASGRMNTHHCGGNLISGAI